MDDSQNNNCFWVGENLSKSNIVLWAKDALAKGDSLNIIDDQFRAPTFAEDLADICILAAKKKHLEFLMHQAKI
ncbi:MAG: hypothetical protein CM15mP112_03030 [Flavobacteriales bacterium]|nr:MAG: hypothetical protein CM15mP112_03030 [Flavobacteriales bacterium]